MKQPKATFLDRKLMDQLTPDPSLGCLLGILAKTYQMQPEFFEMDFLPALFGLGAWDDRDWTSRIALEKQLAELEAAAVLLDARPYRGRPRSLRVEIKPVALEKGNLLHAKVVIAVYEDAVRLFVGSANLTEPGYRRNREIVAVLTASAKRPAEAQLIDGAIREMGTLVEQWATTTVRQLQSMALERLEGWAVEDTEAKQWFTWGGGARHLWRQFVERWPTTDQIQRITIVSPFWSEERANGPITTFVTALKQRGSLRIDAELFLLTEAAPDKQATYKPKLPESFGDFDGRLIGINAKALAVDPRVPPEELGMGADFICARSLHAKVVLLEGVNTSLVFIGSANFTNHGWGFLKEPRNAHIEAGLILLRSGANRSDLQNLVPSSTGNAVPLAGAAAGRLALSDPLPDEPPWPTFLREVLLVTTEADNDVMEMVITIADTTGAWAVSHLPIADSPRQMLLAVEQPEPGRLNYRVSLSENALGRLLREQEVHVEWWECSEGRSFPVNVSASARVALPISPGTGHPEEHQLIAYYQGRIRWEDLFPDPEVPSWPNHNLGDPDDARGVDTSRIQSYIVREFVEALNGIRDDLKTAAHSHKASMRLALLGTVSPVALAKRIVEAADTGARTPTASGFQLVEILACLDTARNVEASVRFQDDWSALVNEATTKVATMLAGLQQRFPAGLSQDFRRYAKIVQQHHLRAKVKG